MDKVQSLFMFTYNRPASEPYKFDFAILLMSFCHCTLFLAVIFRDFLTAWQTD